MLRRLIACLGLVLTAAVSPALAAAAGPTNIQTTWQLLDYVAVDYGGAVRARKVVSASEYAEMREFSASAAEHRLAIIPNA